MEDQLSKPLMAIATMVVLLLTFWRIGLLLPKPENKTENLRNFHCAHPHALFNKDFKCEAFYPLISILITQPLTVLLAFWLMKYAADGLPYQVFDSQIGSMPLLVQVLLGLLVIDISLWIRHSFVHKFLWSFHAVHHCANELTWLTTRRLHPHDQIVMGLIDGVILYVIGFSAEGMIGALVIKDLNNMFVHSNIVLDYPKPLKYILVSPNMHRWHHATEKDAHDKNFCVVFAFIDYIMGTFYVPDNALPKNYGCAMPELDDIDNKNILKELWLPFKPAKAATAADASAKSGDTRPACPEPASIALR